METHQVRGAGGSRVTLPLELEVSAYIQIYHLTSALVNYLGSYGEELTEEKLQRVVADLIVCTVTGYYDKTHYWLTKTYLDGHVFVGYFEKEVRALLKECLPLWREYEPTNFYISIETNGAVLIGFKNMFNGIPKQTLEVLNKHDTWQLDKMQPIMEHSYIVDFSQGIDVDVSYIQSIGSIGITWGYLIEETLRISAMVPRLLAERQESGLLVNNNVSAMDLLPYLDHPELKTRHRSTDLYSRMISLTDGLVVYEQYNSIAESFAELIAKIINVNLNTLLTINQQLQRYMENLGIPGLVNYCIGLHWIGRAAVIQLGTFRNV